MLEIDERTWCEYLLGQMNRNEFSPTAGSFDRRFWCWRTKDLSDATLQYGAVPLMKTAILSPSWMTEAMKEAYWEAAALAALRLSQLQRKNGSLDQTYPHENHPSVIYDTLPVLLLAIQYRGNCLDTRDVEELNTALDKGLRYALSCDERYAPISNHYAHYAFVLRWAAEVLNDSACESKAEEYLGRLHENWSEEGWFREYDGPDFGYQSRVISYLGRLDSRGWLSPEWGSIVRRACEFLSYFAFPDGSFGGEFGSRGTRFMYTYGFAHFGSEISEAAALLAFQIRRYNMRRGVQLTHLDQENVSYFLEDVLDSNALLRVGAFDLAGVDSLPWQRGPFHQRFASANISIVRKNWYYAVHHLGKGGLHRIFRIGDGKLMHSDCGWTCRNGRSLYSNHMTQAVAEAASDMDEDSCTASFFKCQYETLSPLKLLLLRFGNLTFLRLQWLGDLAKRFIVKRLFLKRKPLGIVLRKRICWDEKIRIVWNFEWTDSESKQFVHAQQFTPFIMASGGYFEEADYFKSNKRSPIAEGASPLKCELVIEEDS